MPTLKNLVDEVVNIENEIIECRDTLKQILIDKNIQGVSNENKLSTLISEVRYLDNNRLWLYRDGNMFVDFAPFTSANISGYTCSSYSVQSSDIKLEISNKGTTFVVLSTKEKIDLSKYNKINFEINTIKSHIPSKLGNMIAVCSNFNDMANMRTQNVIDKVGLNIFSMDISNISGEHYIIYSLQTINATVISSNVYKIWLEK